MAGPRNLFDRKFGVEFIKSVPLRPGVYEMLGPDGRTIYVGKARLLRRRLQQYRNAKRCKRHHKMRAILKEAAGIRLSPCATDLDALILENRLIQELRPRFNVAGAFSFLYPMVGLRREGLRAALCYTTAPGDFQMFELYGAFRSREITREAYFALLEILGYLGHREPARKLGAYPRVKFSHVAEFRQVADSWVALLDGFLRGRSSAFLEHAVAALLEKSTARRQAAEVQEWIDQLLRFYKFEALPLRRAMTADGSERRGVAQAERDRLFLRSKHKARGSVGSQSLKTSS